jgi:hypothetical protein
VNNEEIKFTCEICGYIYISEHTFKRHNRDEHDNSTKSTSPKPKKRRKLSNVEKMETDEVEDDHAKNSDDCEVYLADEVITEEPMDEDSTAEVLDQRSNLQDEKVIKKQAELKKNEDEYRKKKEIKAMVENEKKTQIKKAKQVEKKKLKTNQKNQKKPEKFMKTLKPFLRELPPAVKKLIGEHMVLFPVEGDGACGPRTFAAWIFQAPTLGPYLARNINMHFVKYSDYWEDFFGFPFENMQQQRGAI